MRVAVIRGPSLNKFEMQYYEPLALQHEVMAFTSKAPAYDVSEITLPMRRLYCSGQIFGKLPGGIEFLYRLEGDPQRLYGLERSLKGFDIAHTAELCNLYTVQALIAKQKGFLEKVVATVSENIPFNGDQYPKRRRLKEFSLKNLDHILAITEESKKMLVVEGYPQEKITVVPHGIDLGHFKKLEAKDKKLMGEFHITREDFVVLTVCRYVWEKGVYDLLFAASELVKESNKKRSIKFLFVGAGPEKKRLKELRDRLGLTKDVFIHGSVSYQEMPQVYNLADVCVLASIPTPTWQEQFGMVLIEAMACGVPVIGTHFGGIPWVIGNDGILVPPRDPTSLANAIQGLLEKKEVREDLSRRGRERVKKQFDRYVVARRISAVYDNVSHEENTKRGNRRNEH